MAKKKKTLHQKMLSDKRRESQISSLYTVSIESLKQQDKPQIKPQAAPVKQTASISTSSYQYLAKDLTKTAGFTGFIVLAELVLRFLQTR